MRDALQRIGGLRRAAARADRPVRADVFHYRNKLEYSFTQTPEGPALGLHKAGRWDEVLDIEKCWLTTDLGNAIRNAVRDWAREERLPAYSRRTHTGLSPPPGRPRGPQHGQALVQLVTAPGEKFERELLRRGAAAFPRCARSTGRSTTGRPR